MKSAFSYLKAFEEKGAPEEIANAQGNVIDLMGVMGHYVGDAAQPLHTTKHFIGWVGENPAGYSTNRNFHSWIADGYNLKTGLAFDRFTSKIKPAKMLWPGNPLARHDDVFLRRWSSFRSSSSWPKRFIKWRGTESFPVMVGMD